MDSSSQDHDVVGSADSQSGFATASTDPEEETDSPNAGVVSVPMEIYRIVTVLSTLIAAAGVVGGFMILDTATQGAQAPVDEINVVLALIGVGTIVLGAGIYVFSTRFQAPGMRTSKDEDD